MTICLNFYGAPGAGKSTMAASVYAALKWKNINTELVTEYAKEKTWEESLKVLGNQVYIFGKQYHMLQRVSGKVDIIVTDSPLMLSIVYGVSESDAFRALVRECYHRFSNFNYYIRRHKPYNPIGRNQSEAEAELLDEAIKTMLKDEQIQYTPIRSEKEYVDLVVKDVSSILEKK